MSREFDWYGPSVVVPEQQPIAVYKSDVDDDSIKIMQREGDDGYDPVIYLASSYALDFCRAILREAGLHSFQIVHASQLPVSASDAAAMERSAGQSPKDRTAAERQRRHRQAQREAAAAEPTESVTARDCHTVTPEPEATQPEQSRLHLAHG